MAATTSSYSGGTPAPVKLFLIVALIAAAFAVWMVVDVTASHAAIKHATVAATVRQCMGDQHQNAREYFNPTTGRTAFMCQLPDGKFGLQIGYKITGEDKLQEITTFVKEQLKRVEQVERYLANRGYTPVSK